MRRAGAAIVWVAAILAPGAVRAEPPMPVFGRGLNLDIWVEWLGVGEMLARPGFLDVYPDFPRHVAPERLAALPGEGFDFVRVPADPAPLLALGPGRRQDAAIASLVGIAEGLQDLGLSVVVDLHAMPRRDGWGVEETLADAPLFADHLSLAARVATAMSRLDLSRAAFEPMNEPVIDCNAVWGDGTAPDLWPAKLVAMHATLRGAAPDLPLVLSGGCWGGVAGLERIDPAAIADDRVIWSFHSHEPFLFTHQGASWIEGPERVIVGVPYPPSRLDAEMRERLRATALAATDAAELPFSPEDIDGAIGFYAALPDDVAAAEVGRAAAWADSHGIPRARLLLGEFGAQKQRDLGGPLLDPEGWGMFLSDKRRAAEDAGIGWAVWSWTGTIGIAADDASRALHPLACAALGLTCEGGAL